MDIWTQSYVERILRKHDTYYIDTSSLMSRQCTEFINNYKDLFIKYNRQITVIPAVCYELMRHIICDDQIKSRKAMHVLELFHDNPEIFKIENTNLNEDGIKQAFADKEIFARMSLDRSSHSMLLISNDRNLSNDIF